MKRGTDILHPYAFILHSSFKLQTVSDDGRRVCTSSHPIRARIVVQRADEQDRSRRAGPFRSGLVVPATPRALPRKTLPDPDAAPARSARLWGTEAHIRSDA